MSFWLLDGNSLCLCVGGDVPSNVECRLCETRGNGGLFDTTVEKVQNAILLFAFVHNGICIGERHL